MLKPNEIYTKMVLRGEEWAEANYLADLLEETRKSLIAQLGTESGETGIAAKENYALRDPAYRVHVQKMCEARRDANKAKVKYDSLKTWVEVMRTKEANERAANRVAT